MKASGIKEHMMDFMVLLQHLTRFLQGIWIKAQPIKQIHDASSFDIDHGNSSYCALKR